MQTEVEAPVTEPLSFRERDAAVPQGHRALEEIDLAVRQDELIGRRRPVRLRQVDAARAGGRPAGARRRQRDRAGRHDAAARRAACAYMPQRDLLLPVAGRARQRRARARVPGRAARGGAPPRRAAVRALRPGRVRARTPGRAVRRDAPARRLPAHAAAGPARAAPRRAVRGARLAHARGDAGVAGRRARRASRARCCS